MIFLIAMVGVFRCGTSVSLGSFTMVIYRQVLNLNDTLGTKAEG